MQDELFERLDSDSDGMLTSNDNGMLTSKDLSDVDMAPNHTSADELWAGVCV